MYELDRYIMPFHKTNFNPFRLAAAVASCSPPSPASGDGFHKMSAPYARHFILSPRVNKFRLAEFATKQQAAARTRSARQNSQRNREIFG